MATRCVTANLACGGPGSAARSDEAIRWLRQLTEVAPQIDLAFLQETPAEATDALTALGWTVHGWGDARTYRCRSLVAVRGELAEGSEPLELDTAGYHGSYLAAARLVVPAVGEVVAVSYHASPSKYVVTDQYPGDLPGARDVGGRRPELWDADLVVETLARVAGSGHQVLAAGDLNESRRYDEDHGEPWAHLLFATALRQGLHAATFGEWGGETPTRGRYQIDHVLATQRMAARLSAFEVADPDGAVAAPFSDHQPVTFELREGADL